MLVSSDSTSRVVPSRLGSTRWAAAAAIALYLLIYVFPLGVRPLILPDEIRYAEIAREMLAGGDWVAPRLDGIRYFEKPVLGYWAGAVSQAVLGENAFAARLPSALAAGATALAVFFLLACFGPGSRTGLFGGGIYLTMAMVFGLGTFNVLDSLLAFFLTGSCAAFFAFWRSTGPRRRRLSWLAVCGAFCGLAFLTKGFLAFAVPTAAALPFLLWERRWLQLLRVPWLPLFFASVVIAPWALLIAWAEPDFWRYFFWIEHVQRFFSDTPQHPAPFWYFLPVMLGGALPWTFLVPSAAAGVRKNIQSSSLIRFAICWLAGPLLFFSASSGKLATYVLPCFAPLAVLLALGIETHLASGRNPRLFTGALMLMGAIAAVLAVGMVSSPLLPFPGLHLFSSSEMWKPAFSGAGLAVLAFLAIYAAGRDGRLQRMALLTLAPAALFLSGHFLLPDKVEMKKAPGAFLWQCQGWVTPGATIVADEALVAGVCWYYGRDDVRILMNGGELNYGLRYADSAGYRLGLNEFNDMAASRERQNPVVLIADARFYERNETQLTEPQAVRREGRFVMAHYGNDIPRTLKPSMASD